MTATPHRFRQLPIVVEALVYDGSDAAWEAVCQFVPEGWHLRRHSPQSTGVPFLDELRDETPYLTIRTAHGEMRGNVGEWVVRGLRGEVWFCAPVDFDAYFTLAEAQA